MKGNDLLGRKLQRDNVRGILFLLEAVVAKERRKHFEQTASTHSEQLETDILKEKDLEDPAITTTLYN